MEELKKRQDQEAAAEVPSFYTPQLLFNIIDMNIDVWFPQVFEEFVATFQEDSSKVSKVWVKAGTYDAGQRSMFHPIVFIETRI